MKRKIILSIVTFAVILGSVTYYFNRHISLWGFTLSKGELNRVIIDVDNKRYWILNREVAVDIAELSSKMKKHEVQKTSTSPILPINKPISSFDIQTSDHTTYGGIVWRVGSDLVLDINGYYWVLGTDVTRALEEAIKAPGTDVETLY